MHRLFQALWLILDSSSYSRKGSDGVKAQSKKEVMENLIDTWRISGQLDPALPVNEDGAPLVFALARQSIPPVEWLDVFLVAPENFSLFEPFNGKTLGDLFFEKMADKGFADKDHFEWWLVNAPSLDPKDVEDWTHQLTRAHAAPGSAKGPINTLLSLLIPMRSAPETGQNDRSQERWSNSSGWWESLLAQGRMDDLVPTVSGRRRSLRESLRILNADGRQFGEWENGAPEQKQEQPLRVPHRRSKELVWRWVLGKEDMPLENRVRRLIKASMETVHFMPELYRATQTPGYEAEKKILQEMLEFRPNSGLGLVDWFSLLGSSENAITLRKIEREILPKRDPAWPNVHGHGMLWAKLNSILCPAEEIDPSQTKVQIERPFIRTLDEELSWKSSLVGDGAGQEDLVDLMVDLLVSRKPPRFAIDMAEIIISSELLSSERQKDKIQQAFGIARVADAFLRLDSYSRMSFQASKKGYAYHPGTANAEDQMDILLSHLSEGRWALKISTSDWEALLAGWGASPNLLAQAPGSFRADFERFNVAVLAEGSRLDLAEGTAPTSLRRPGPRL